MTDVRHYIDNQIANPRDFESFQITMEWIGRKSEASINIDSLKFVGADGIKLRDRFLSGTTGGVGAFEGEPYRIEVGPLGNPDGVFNGFIDFKKKTVFIGKSEIEVALTRMQGTDWLVAVADGFSYRFLEDEGIITDQDFIDIPYVINYIPDTVQLLILGLSTFTLVKELVENIKSLSDRISDLTDAATPVLGVSVGVGGGVVTAYDIGNIILAALKLIAQIAYLVAITIALVKLTQQIVEELMPPKRFHKGMSLKKLVEKGCEYLNLTLDSQLLDDISTGIVWTIMPAKDHKGGGRPTGAGPSFRETGVPRQNGPFDTFGKVIRVIREWFNADYKIVDGTLFLERRDKFRTQSSYSLADNFINQEKAHDENTFNTNEAVSSYNINYSTDIQDQNTLDNQQGRIFQAQLKPINQSNPDLYNLSGLREVQIPCSLPVRKNELTTVEEIVKAFATLADTITGQLGSPTSLSGQINNRIGTMHLSSDFTSVPKVVAMQGSKLATNQRDILGAKGLWDDFHSINSFAPINGVHNQYWIYEGLETLFCFEDFVSLLGNNLVKTVDGRDAEIMKLVWTSWADRATIDYRVNRLYDTNFELVEL